MKNKKTPWLSPDGETIILFYIAVGSYLMSVITSLFESTYKFSRIFLCISTLFLIVMVISFLKRSKK